VRAALVLFPMMLIAAPVRAGDPPSPAPAPTDTGSGPVIHPGPVAEDGDVAPVAPTDVADPDEASLDAARHASGPDPSRHDDGLYIDAGEGAPRPLTDAERRKFEIAWGVRALPRPAPAAAPVAETVIPGVTPSPAAGVGPDLPCVQERGPSGLTPYERGQREAALARQRGEAAPAPEE